MNPGNITVWLALLCLPILTPASGYRFMPLRAPSVSPPPLRIAFKKELDLNELCIRRRV